MGVMRAEGGADVSLIARGAHLDAIQKNGLIVQMKDGAVKNARLEASDNPADLGQPDYVIVALKAHQAWQVAEQMSPLFGPDTAVVTAQNGVPWWYFHGVEGELADQRLASVDPDNRQWNTVGPKRMIGCTVYTASEIIEPGVIKHTYGERFGLGEPSGEKSERVQLLANVMKAGGLKARIYPDIRTDIWMKLWGNLCFNPISVLTGATLDVIATDPGTKDVAAKMMGEAQQIGERLGVKFNISIDKRIDGAAAVGAHRTSMLQDLDKNRAIELDAMLTAVKEMGALVEIETPFIDAVLALTQQMGRVAGVYPAYTR